MNAFDYEYVVLGGFIVPVILNGSGHRIYTFTSTFKFSVFPLSCGCEKVIHKDVINNLLVQCHRTIKYNISRTHLWISNLKLDF